MLIRENRGRRVDARYLDGQHRGKIQRYLTSLFTQRASRTSWRKKSPSCSVWKKARTC
ncbi:MAG: hypothetical protein U0703_13425 [Anaerolineae bacterium]